MGSFALVTGASAGIGKELARSFAAEGHGLVLVARREAELEKLAAELAAEHKVDVRIHACDLGRADAREGLFAATKDLEIEFLVNNAGFGSNGPFWENDAEREVGMVDLNVTALTHLTRHYLPGMVARRRGRVLNIGSTAGFQPGPFMATYYATKAFVNSFTEALAFELRGTGVTATVSCPGPVATDFASIAGNDKTALFKRAGGVASAAWVAKEAYAAMKNGKAVAIHGAQNKLGVAMVGMSPRSLIVSIAAKLNRAEP